MVPGRIVSETYRDGNDEIYVMNADGTGVAPDEQQLPGRRTPMDADGTNVMRITNAAGPNWEPTVSVDGRRVAFSTERQDTGRTSEIFVINLDGTGETQITYNSTWDLEPSWPGR